MSNPAFEHDERDNSVDEESLQEEEEEELKEQLDEIDEIEQIKANLSVPPVVAEMTQETSVQSKRFRLLSKLPFFGNSTKSKKPSTRRLKLHQVYRFADKLDIFLMIIGSIAGSFHFFFIKNQ